MLKIFMDTEFTGLHQNTTLISIGMVSERGDTFYAEFNDYNKDQCDDWIIQNVLANLKFSPPSKGEDDYFVWSGGTSKTKNVELRGNTEDITQYIDDWFQDILGGPLSWIDYGGGNEPEYIKTPSLEIWSDCLAYDWVLFNELWGHAFSIPKCVYYIPFDICTVLKLKGIDPDIDREEYSRLNETKHNALSDANMIKACYERAIKC